MSGPAFVVPAHDKYAIPLDFTPDGATMFTGGFDGTVKGFSAGEWQETSTLAAHEQSVNDGALVGSDTLVTGSTDTTVRVWDLVREERLAVLEGHAKTVAGVASHPGREVVASASYDSTVRLWDVEEGVGLAVLKGHSGNATSVAFVGDGDTLASGGLGDEVIVWSLDESAPIARLGGHGAAVVGSAAGDDALWTVGHGGTVHEWSTTEWTERSSFDLPSGTEPSGVAVHPADDRIAVSKAGGTLVFDTAGDLLEEHETSIKGNLSPCWSPEGTWLAVGGADGNVRVYG